ncbi:hypothetical protein ACLOJK_007444 [Asimina triloba]
MARKRLATLAVVPSSSLKQAKMVKKPRSLHSKWALPAAHELPNLPPSSRHVTVFQHMLTISGHTLEQGFISDLLCYYRLCPGQLTPLCFLASVQGLGFMTSFTLATWSRLFELCPVYKYFWYFYSRTQWRPIWVWAVKRYVADWPFPQTWGIPNTTGPVLSLDEDALLYRLILASQGALLPKKVENYSFNLIDCRWGDVAIPVLVPDAAQAPAPFGDKDKEAIVRSPAGSSRPVEDVTPLVA